VATSAPPEQSWANTTLIEGGLPGFVTELKRMPGHAAALVILTAGAG